MRFLLIDDNPDHRELVKEILRREWPKAEFDEGYRRADFDASLEQGGFDIALIDYHLRWSNGLALLKLIRERYPYTPVIMVTGTGSEEVAVSGMKSGLSDYVLKGHWQRLPIAVRESIEKEDLRKRHDKTQDRLKLSEERYRICSELTSDFAYSFQVVESGQLAVEWVTAAFYRITGYVPEELDLSRGWEAIVHSADRDAVAGHYDRLLEGEPAVTEFRIQTKSGVTRWVKDYSRPLREGAQGPIIRIIGAAQDYTFVRQAQEQELMLARELAARQQIEASAEALRESEAQSRRLAEHWRAFFQGAADQLRDPLNELNRAAGLLETEHEEALNEDGRRCVQELVRAANRLREFIESWKSKERSSIENGGRRRPQLV
jgi:PAS domain S-box-containing protein